MPADPLQRCVAALARFPGVGERTATRLAYWLLRMPPEVAEEIAAALVELRRNVVECEVCCDVSTRTPCSRCRDEHRDSSLICVVEHPQDVAAIERGGAFSGRYHVLHGAVSPLDGVLPEDLRIAALLKRLEGGGVREVVLATDPDVEGDATALYLARLLKPLGLRVTRLAHGIPVGTEIEYADRASLARAVQNRREL
ncbi:MAG: recombination protein RecR [Deltaproteobacteria bacterium]|nr:recombination protein RecR [Deltaproteobacteria bacterium]